MIKDLILIALQDEAPDMTYSMKVFYTGVGKVNAAMTASELIVKYNPKRVINFGTAGGITVKSGFHQVTKFVQRDMICCELGSLPGQTPFEEGVILDNGIGLTCSTGDNFVTDSNLLIPADVVDMEAYAIAKVCKKYNIEFLCYKFISDGANEDSSNDWRTTVSRGQVHYLNKLKELNISLIQHGSTQ
jgi:adenosylhomocysteine nucleosidase